MVTDLLQSIPPVAVYLVVAVVIMVESLGIPIPGELTLISAALLSSQHELAVSPLWIAICGSLGAIVGDSIGFAIGHRFGRSLFDWLGRKFPKHFGPKHVAFAEGIFTKYGVWAVFFGRFIAILRIFAGPLAGSLKMPYHTFLAANAAGGIAWASGTTFLIYYLGVVAETWLHRFSWIGLIVAVVVGVAISLLIKRKTGKLVENAEATDDQPSEAKD